MQCTLGPTQKPQAKTMSHLKTSQRTMKQTAGLCIIITIHPQEDSHQDNNHIATEACALITVAGLIWFFFLKKFRETCFPADPDWRSVTYCFHIQKCFEAGFACSPALDRIILLVVVLSAVSAFDFFFSMSGGGFGICVRIPLGKRTD